MPAQVPPTPGAVPGLVVAVDGPSGSGKSSVSREVARRLGVAYLDTGAMYRALTWDCLQAGVDLDDAEAVAARARAMDLRLSTDPDAPSVAVGGRRVDEEIRTPQLSAVVSRVATNLGVRAELVRRQRELVEAASTSSGGVVVEGRDITTVVVPQAPVRVLLTADEDARLARRGAQHTGTTTTDLRDQVLRRDADDATVSSFHVAADGVATLDSSALDLEQTVEALLALVAARAGVLR